MVFCGVQEMEQMQRYNQRLVEEMKNKQTQERARLPKIQRSEAKTRMAMFKKSLRITAAAITPEQERERVKQVRARGLAGLVGGARETVVTFVFVSSVCSSGGEEAEERAAPPAAETREPHERPAAAV